MREFGTFVAQTTASWVVLMLILLVSVSIESPPYDGGLASVGWPIGAALIGVITNGIVAGLGMGFRFFGRTRRWLQRHGRVMMLVTVGGILMVALSYLLGHPVTRDDDLGNPYPGYEPQVVLFAIGWFVTAAGIVHTWPPSEDGGPGWLRNLGSTAAERENHRLLYGDPPPRDSADA